MEVEARDEQGMRLAARLTVLTMDELRVDRVRLEVEPLLPDEDTEEDS